MDATHNLGLNLLSSPDKWGKLGPLANETHVEVRKRGATEMRRPGGTNNDAGRRGDDNRDARGQTKQGPGRHDDQTGPHTTPTSQE